MNRLRFAIGSVVLLVAGCIAIGTTPSTGPATKEALDTALTHIKQFVERPVKNLLIVEDNDQQRKAIIDRLQAVMAIIEGHAEHVMDAAGAAVLPSLPKLREALEKRRREKPPLVKLLERLLGLDLKLRQYVVGKRFCDAVVRDWGIEGLNRAWSGAENLPTLAELDDPPAWVRRTQVRAVAPGE